MQFPVFTKKQMFMIDVSLAIDGYVSLKETESFEMGKFSKYKEEEILVTLMQNLRTEIIPIIIGALSMCLVWSMECQLEVQLARHHSTDGCKLSKVVNNNIMVFDF